MPEAMQAEQPEGFFQYLPPSQYDQVIGFSITDFGWTHIEPGMLYPPWQHPTEFSFTSTKGRLLDEYQLVYITRGRGTFWSSITGTIEISKGMAFLLFPGVRHKYSPDPETGWNEQWFGFNGDMARRIMEHYFDPAHPVLQLGIQSELFGLFEKLRTTSQSGTAGFRRIMAITAQEIITRLHVASHADSAINDDIESACLHIAEHFKESIDFEAYAESMGQSYSSFRRHFKQYTGLAPHQYQLAAKLRNAKQLLDNSSLSVNDIAQSSGFESPFYFSRYFKTATGLSPSKYRNRAELSADD